MAYYRRNVMPPTQFGGMVPPVIKRLLIANGVLFVVYFLAVHLEIGPLVQFFRALSLIPSWLVLGAIWQPVTYLFLHSPFGFSHILFNSLMLWMFGADLERQWGGKRFLQFYLFCGVGAGLVDAASRIVMGELGTATIGNSGAVYGILLAFGLLYPDRPIYFWMLFPIPARIFVLILGVIAFLSTIGSSGSQVAHVAHLAGMAFAWIYLRHRPKFLNVDWLASYQQWRLRRSRRRFEVYMKKRDRQGGGPVN